MSAQIDEETREIVDCFLTEGREAIEELESLLLAFEGSDRSDATSISAMFRIFHSIKGSAGYLEFSLVERVTHQAETVLQKIRDGEMALTRQLVDCLCAVLDFLNERLNHIDATMTDAGKEDVATSLVGRLQVFLSAASAPAPFSLSTPAPAAPAPAAPATAAAAAPEAARPTLVEAIEAAEAAEAMDVAEVVEVPSGGEEGEGKRGSKETLRVDVHKLNSLMDLVGELIIAATAIIHDPQLAGLEIESFQKSSQRLGRVTRSLQDVAMSVRMVPVEGTFRKMNRLVRDVSHKQGKQVELRISGEETEVDKKVAEIIADPLVHLMRNAIDHGMETVEERRRTGKPEVGVITLSARHQGGEIWIEIQDDGRGMDRDRILQKAREKGMPDAHRVDLTDQQVFGYIFAAGFSTAAQVSDISGRGIGMDVVKRNIEQVKGRIDVHSRLGRGTTFTLRIPLTLAIIEGMLVRVGAACFTIPLLQIKESVVVSPRDIVRLSDGQELARIRNQLIPVLRLHQLYELEPDTTELSRGILVVVEDGGQALSLFVDELIGQRQTVVKALSRYLGDIPGLSGCTVLGDGRISLIIDVTNLIDRCARAA